jgi:transposase
MVLDPVVQARILQLHYGEGLSRRKVAEQLKVGRKAVGRVIARRSVRLHGEPRSRPPSLLVPYCVQIGKLLDDAPGRSAVTILQRLRNGGYTGGITILRDYLRQLRPATPPKEPFNELQFAMGEAAQVDWGEFGDVFGDGTMVHCFVMVLCWSRLLYLEFTLRETLGAFLRCFTRALRFFGGRCRESWLDNMPTVVAERVGRLIRLTVGFQAYAGFHGFTPVLCNKGRGNEKGRVEDGVKLVRYQFWPGRAFRDLVDLNQQSCDWRDGYANRREHATTGMIPELAFAQERAALLPLRPEAYETDDVISALVSRFYRVDFDANRYSVPWTLVGKTVTVRADDDQVGVFYGPKRVAHHQRCYLRGKTIVNPTHQQGIEQIKPGAAQAWPVAAVEAFGPETRRYLELITAGTRSIRSELRELLCLGTVYGPDQVERVIGELLVQGIVGVSRVERALRLSVAEPKAPPPMPLSDERLRFAVPTPQLADYDQLLLEARHGDDPAPEPTHGVASDDGADGPRHDHEESPP